MTTTETTPKPKIPERLSEEDQQLKDQIEAKVDLVLTSSDSASVSETLASLLSDVRTVSGGMTTVPKPLRFLRPHYASLADRFTSSTPAIQTNKAKLADVLGVVATVVAQASVLTWRLAGSRENLALFGTEFARSLTRELPDALSDALADQAALADQGGTTMGAQVRVEELTSLIDEIIEFYGRSNAEIEAVDLLAEVDMLEKLVPLIDEHNVDRVVLYLASTARISPVDARDACLTTAVEVSLRNGRFPGALRLALRLSDDLVQVDTIARVIIAAQRAQGAQGAVVGVQGMQGTQGMQGAAVGGTVQGTMGAEGTVVGGSQMQKQLALMLGSHSESWKSVAALEKAGASEWISLAQNERLAGDFKRVMVELEAGEAKTPEDVFKTHLEERSVTGGGATQLDSAKQNLASSLVNAFVNMGSGVDKLLLVEGSNWLYKTKELGLFATAASIALLHLWDLDEGLAALDKYQWSNDPYVKAGALLGFGLVAGGKVNNDCDPALALLAEHLSGEAVGDLEGSLPPHQAAGLTRLGAALGLGFAYAGSRREEVRELLTVLLFDGEVPLETAAMAAVSLALVFVGSADVEIANVIVQALNDRLPSDTAAAGSLAAGPTNLGLMFVAALGVLVLGAGSAAAASVAGAVSDGALPEDLTDLINTVVVEGFAAAGSGDVLVVQKMLQALAASAAPTGVDEAPTVAATTLTTTVPVTTTTTTTTTTGATTGATPTGVAVSWGTLKGPLSLLSLALAALGEPIGEEMAQRLLDHAHQFCDHGVKRAIPLVVALLSASDPRPGVVETLGKFAHDADPGVGLSGVVGLGLVGFGSNNARIGGILRQQAAFFSKEPDMLFAVRLAQGLLHAGKGLVALRLESSDGWVGSKVGMAGMGVLLMWLVGLGGGGGGGVTSAPYMWYLLTLCVRPRMLVTVRADTMEPVSVTVRVGQKLDVVGQAGKQAKTITGFQTHTTPVLVSPGERAELANEDWVSLTPVLEGVVMVKEEINK